MRRTVVSLLAFAGGLALVPAASAAPPAHRTFPLTLTPFGAPLDGAVSDPALAGDATAAAFVTTATTFTAQDPNGPVADVMRIDLPSGVRRRVSEAFDGSGANGPSRSPTISASGLTVAFVSDASNLVSGDTNGVADIFVRNRDGATVLVSAAPDGSPANGPSSQPDISDDGRFVAFTSSADNLVPGDTNGVDDVLVRDLARGTTRRASVSSAGAQADGESSAPAIDADGGVVAFDSEATNLVTGDTNRVGDVFVHDADGSTDRVSISTKGGQQDRAIAAPFRSAPDISGNGRFVVFDTDASRLYRLDTNKHTDVYLRDRRKGTTTLVSASSVNVQGNNDSITPLITPNGRFVSFQSFASNLVPTDGPREDLFVRDLRSGTTSLVNATDSGAVRAPEPGPGQLLQRAPIASDGRSAVFLSAAANVTPVTSTAPIGLFARNLTAPAVGISGHVARLGSVVRLKVTADDPAARQFLCRVDQGQPFYCGPRITLKATAGRVLSVRAGGPGMLWSAAKSVPLAHG